MMIRLNGEAAEFPSGATLPSLIARSTGQTDPQGIAVALNGRVIGRNQWTSVTLGDGDEIEILQAVAGG